MKKFLLFFLVVIIEVLSICMGQSYTHKYYFKDDLIVTKPSKANIIGKGLMEDGLFRLDYFSKKEGVKLMSVHYVDSSLKIKHGLFTLFDKNGNVLSNGNYLDHKKDGLWENWDLIALKADSVFYQDDKALTQATYYFHKNGIVSYYSFKDSLADIYKTVSFNDKGKMTAEAFFKGQAGIVKEYDSGMVKWDSVFTREEREASFSGGQAGWIKYLQNNLNANTPVDLGAPAGTYQVFVKFIVAEDGKISDVLAETAHGYGMENELIRILENGPAWEPAVRYGRKVKAYRRQPVTFFVEDIKVK